MTWKEVYQTDVQGLWSLIVVPALFLVWRATAARRADGPEGRFVAAWSIVFAIETILDPVATGPLVRWLGVADGAAGQVILFLFVWLGDFRVFFLLFGVADPTQPGRAARTAAAWSFVVPVFTLVALRGLRAAVGELPGVAMWIVYEAGFLTLALAFLVRARIAATRPELHRYVREVFAYAATYYALWLLADLLVLANVDAGWALRIVPNQLYYAFFVPVAWARYVSTSASAHAVR